jgi:dihydroorotate dehydrogenase (NAD+) catalytic subunit
MTRALISQGPVPGKGPVAHIDMTAQLGDLVITSPVLTASGCAAAGRELDQFFDITRIGGIVTKSVMLQPRSGRPTPRMAETPSGMLNSIGLQGPGIDHFIEHDLAWLNERGATTIVSIAGSTVDEYGKLASKLRPTPGVAAIEVNISCPNVENRGLVFACDPAMAANVVQLVRRNSDPRMPIFAKLSPDVTDIVSIAESVVRAGATGVSVINTLLGMVINPDTMRPHLAGVTGGLSGPAIRPVAVRCVWQIRQAFPDLPIIGMGGIRTGMDALEFILAGANAVSVGTMVFHDPSSPLRIHEELQRALVELGFGSLSDAISYAHRDADAPPLEDEDGDVYDFITE